MVLEVRWGGCVGGSLGSGLAVSEGPSGLPAWIPRMLFLAHLTNLDLGVRRLGLQKSWPRWLEGSGQVPEMLGSFLQRPLWTPEERSLSSRGKAREPEGFSLPWKTAWMQWGGVKPHCLLLGNPQAPQGTWTWLRAPKTSLWACAARGWARLGRGSPALQGLGDQLYYPQDSPS